MVHDHAGVYQPVGSYAPATGIAPSAITGTAVVDNDARLTNSRPASDVSAWAKEGSKPSYTAAEVGAAVVAHEHIIADIDLKTPTPTAEALADDDLIMFRDVSGTPANKTSLLSRIWDYIQSKIDAGQTWAGNHAFSTRPTSSGSGIPAYNSLITRDDLDAQGIDFSRVVLRDDFMGGIDAAVSAIGELGWVRVAIGGAGTFRPNNVSSYLGYGVAGLHTQAAHRAAQALQFDASNLIGGQGFALSALATPTAKVTFRIRLHGLNARVAAGFSATVNATHLNTLSRKLVFIYTPPTVAWTPNFSYPTTGVFVRPTTSNGRRYFVSAVGVSGAVEPSWPTTNGGTTTDNTVTWTEAGSDGHVNWHLMSHATAGETGGVMQNTGIVAAANTWYNVTLTRSGGNWIWTINGSSISMTSAINSSDSYGPIFYIENASDSLNELSIDYWGMNLRVTRS